MQKSLKDIMKRDAKVNLKARDRPGFKSEMRFEQIYLMANEGGGYYVIFKLVNIKYVFLIY